MKILKSRCPKIDPCDTHAIMSYEKLKKVPILVLCLRIFRSSKRIFKLILSRLNASNFAISKSWVIQ